MADGFYAMPVGIEDEGAEIVRVIWRPQPGRPVVPTARPERGGVEGTHRGSIWRAETKMHSGRRRAIQFNRDREFHSKRPCHRAVVGSTAFAEVDGPHDPQRAQGGVIELATALEISHAKGYMVQHIVAPRGAIALIIVM